MHFTFSCHNEREREREDTVALTLTVFVENVCVNSPHKHKTYNAGSFQMYSALDYIKNRYFSKQVRSWFKHSFIGSNKEHTVDP